MTFKMYYKTEDFEEPEDKIYYLLASNGIFLCKTTPFFKSVTEVKEMPGLEKAKNRLVMTLPSRISNQLLGKILAFFRWAYETHKSEAIVLLYWSDGSKEYVAIPPEQDVSPAALAYKLPATPKGMTRVGTIHSHAGFSAFHSCTDIKDEENEDGLHITIGNVDTAPTYSAAFVADGIRFPIGANHVAVFPEVPLVKEWTESVTYVPPKEVKRGSWWQDWKNREDNDTPPLPHKHRRPRWEDWDNLDEEQKEYLIQQFDEDEQEEKKRNGDEETAEVSVHERKRRWM